MQTRERMCVSCRQHYNKQNMLRVARINGEFVLDTKHKLDGRGAYVCVNCLDKISKKKQLNRSFKQNVPEEVYKQVEEYEQNS